MNHERGLIGIVVLIVIVVAVGAGATVYFTRQGTPGTSPFSNGPLDTARDGTPVKQDSSAGETSLADRVTGLLPGGKGQKCTISFSDANTTTTGTIYLADEANPQAGMRLDMRSRLANGTVTNGHMIQDGGPYAYQWSDGENQGLKIPLDVGSDAGTPTNATAGSPVNPQEIVSNQNARRNCESWSVDDSKFVPPAHVTFVDFSNPADFLQQGPPGPQQQDQCAVCNQLQGAARTECIQAFGC